MVDPAVQKAARSWLAIGMGIVLIVIGAPMAYGGGLLLTLGGSAYYLPTGVGLVISGILLLLQRPLGGWLYAALYVATLLWAVGEVGLDFWKLSPRIIAPTVLAIPVFICLALLQRRLPADGGAAHRFAHGRVAFAAALVAAVLLVAYGIAALYPHDARYGLPHRVATNAELPSEAGDWSAYGRTNEGRRFAPFSQINKDNVARLKVAWVAHTGDVPSDIGLDENTPLQIGDKLVTCSPRNIVNAFDVETGKTLWTFDPKAKGLRERCRGVGYFTAAPRQGGDPAATGAPACSERIVLTTIDARLIELDARDGKRCKAFGRDGQIDLAAGLGQNARSQYFLVSAPTVTKGLIIVGGLVMDGASVDMPSGVVRAFDAATGDLRWVWDLGNVNDPNALPSPSTTFTRGTPNVWAPISVDEKLGLVYLPTGNPSPDHWGGNRTPVMERFGSSVVALELETGKVRWSFQTTHHDLWDYDVPSQPTLYDIPDGKGGHLPALIQPTKRGEIFLLDRRTGKPIARVEEKAVPQGKVIGDRTARTQPYSVGMPTISAPRIQEADMWGLTPVDQLWCRITFRKLRYEGDFTPPDVRPSLLFPGVFGGMNWGSASIDEVNNYLIVNDIRIGDMLALVPRDEADRDGKKVLGRLSSQEIQPGHGGLFLQTGAPYAAMYAKFMSPLGLPCNAPPYGTLTAIDLKTRKIAWQVPMGTTEDTGPLGIKMILPMPVGLPTIGGSLVTKSGLIFFAGTQDFYLRAIDSSTGREIWKSRMPIGAGATPMTFISPRSKRQFVIVSASGSRNSPVKSDLIIAYALPEAGKGQLTSARLQNRSKANSGSGSKI